MGCSAKPRAMTNVPRSMFHVEYGVGAWGRLGGTWILGNLTTCHVVLARDTCRVFQVLTGL